MRPIPNLAKTLMRRLDTYHFVRPPPPSSLYCPNCLAVPLSRPRPRLSEKSALSALVRLLCDRRHFSITPSSIASDGIDTLSWWPKRSGAATVSG